MDDKRAVDKAGPRDYLRGYRDGVKRIVEHLLGKEDIARRGLAALRTPTATAVSPSSAEAEEVSFVPPSELLVVVKDAAVPRIGELILQLEKAGLEVEKGNIDRAAGTIVGLVPRQGLPCRIQSLKMIAGVEAVEEMLCVSLVVDDKHLSSANLGDVVTRAKSAGLRLKSTNAAIGILIGTARPGSLEPLRRVVGVARVETINC